MSRLADEALNSLSAGFFARHLGAFLAGFRQPDCNRLFPTLDAPSLPAFSRTERSVFTTTHCAPDGFLCTSSVSRHRFDSFWWNSSALAFRFRLAKDFNHRSTKCRDIVGLSRRDELAVHDDFFVDPLCACILQIRFQRWPGRNLPVIGRTRFDDRRRSNGKSPQPACPRQKKFTNSTAFDSMRILSGFITSPGSSSASNWFAFASLKG